MEESCRQKVATEFPAPSRPMVPAGYGVAHPPSAVSAANSAAGRGVAQQLSGRVGMVDQGNTTVAAMAASACGPGAQLTVQRPAEDVFEDALENYPTWEE